MGNGLTGLLRVSMLVAIAGALSFAVFFSNCGGSGGMRNTGTAGTTGGGGTTGSAGTTGSGGSVSTGGTGGVVRNTCTPKPDLTCGASAITLPDGHVTDFGPAEWNDPAGKYCNTRLQGSVFAYAGGPTPAAGPVSSGVSKVEAAAANYRLSLTAGSAGYAGAGISFEGCVDASAFNGLRFTASLMSGDLTGCNFKSQLQTFEQRPLSQNPPGGCDPDAGASCYRFPASPDLAAMIMANGATPTTLTIKFADYTTAYTHVMPVPGQFVGLQWQLESGAALTDGGAQPNCTVEIRIDDINFVTVP
jgi:hypothetical protein